MSPRKFEHACGIKQYELFLKVSAYGTPPMPHARLFVTLEDGPQIFTVLSVNFPDLPTPGPRQFYVKTWGENEGLLEQLVALGAVKLVDAKLEGIVINQWGSRTFVAELAWPDSDLKVSLPPGCKPLLQCKGSNSMTTAADPTAAATAAASSGGDTSEAAGGRGTRYEKNQRKRDRKKERKAAAAAQAAATAGAQP